MNFALICYISAFVMKSFTNQLPNSVNCANYVEF